MRRVVCFMRPVYTDSGDFAIRGLKKVRLKRLALLENRVRPIRTQEDSLTEGRMQHHTVAYFRNYTTMNIRNRHVFELHAEFCKVMANPKRLMIISLLSGGEMNVGDIVKAMDTRLSNVSQHLRVLRSRNIVATRKDGQMIYYRLTDRRINKVLVEVRKILVENLKATGNLSKKVSEQELTF